MRLHLFTEDHSIKRTISIAVLIKQMENGSRIRLSCLFFRSVKNSGPSKKQAMIIETTGAPLKRVIVFLFAPIEAFLECVKRKRLEMS